MPKPDGSWAKNLIGILVVVGFLGITFYIVAYGLNVDQNSGPLVGQVIGSVGTLAGLVVGYHFGSSASSNAKDQVIKDQATNATATAATVAANVVSAANAGKSTSTDRLDVTADTVNVKENPASSV